MAELEVRKDVFAERDRQDSYSFTDCQKIGKEFLDKLKQSIIRSTDVIEEPRVKATKYLEETEVLQLLEDLIAKLVFMRPEKPIDFLIKEMEELKRKGTQESVDDKAS